MVKRFRFFRLVRKHQTGVGRRYYRLVSYPQDECEMPDVDAAKEYATRRQYQAIYTANQQWITFNANARQCVSWHMAGKDGYVNVL